MFPGTVQVLQRLVKGVNGFVSVNVKRLSKKLASMQIRVGVPCLAPCAANEFEFPALLQVPSSEGDLKTAPVPETFPHVEPQETNSTAASTSTDAANHKTEEPSFSGGALSMLTKQLSKVFTSITGSGSSRTSNKIVPSS
jgi:hypothetical protein